MRPLFALFNYDLFKVISYLSQVIINNNVLYHLHVFGIFQKQPISY